MVRAFPCKRKTKGSKIEICLKSGISWIHKAKSGTISTQTSWRAHWRPRIYIDESFQFGSQICPEASSEKIPDAKAAVEKEWKKLETFPAWKLEKVRSKKEIILEAQRQKESPLCLIDGHKSPEECGVRTKTPEEKRSNCSLWWHC